jgi:hypothetical protein
MGLIAIPQAKSVEDQYVYLLESKMEYLGMDTFLNSGCIDVGLAKIEVGLKEGNGPILEAWIKDGHMDLLASEAGKVRCTMPSC